MGQESRQDLTVFSALGCLTRLQIRILAGQAGCASKLSHWLLTGFQSLRAIRLKAVFPSLSLAGGHSSSSTHGSLQHGVVLHQSQHGRE